MFVEVYGREIDFVSLPAASQLWLIKEGLTHGAGNRVASQAIGAFRAEARKAWIDSHSAEAWKALSKAEQGSIEKGGIPDSESAEYRQALEELRAEWFNDLLAGTLSEGRSSGPKKSPLEVEMEAIAKRETQEIFVKQGLFVATNKKRVPKAEDEFDIKGEVLSFSDWSARRLAKNEERIRREAEKTLAARDKAASKAAGEDLAEAF